MYLRIEQWLLHHLHVLSRDYCDIRRTLNSTPGPLRPHTMLISRCNTSIPRMWTDLGKPRYTVNRVTLTKNSLQAPLVALNYSVEYFHGKYTGLFQAFRWAENGASGEQRGNNKRAGIKKESNMSIITQWRPYFHSQRIQPTQLVDPQLIMYFFFIWRLLNNFLW